MPRLSERVRPLDNERWGEVLPPQAGAVPALSVGTQPNNNPFIRSPLPPIPSSPDNLRQFYQGGLIPQTRGYPPAYSTSGGSGGTTVNNTSVTQSSSSAGAATNTLKQASITTQVLSQGQQATGAVTMAKAAVIIRLSVSASARVELYSTSAAQAADAGRTITQPVPIGVSTGIIADWYLFQQSEFSWLCTPAVVGFNGDSPQLPTIYYAVTNPLAVSTPITVTFSFFEMES